MNDSMYLLEQFVAVAPGEAFRLFPFGKIVKGGKVREITRKLAEMFRLPHFKPPIKLGSHKEETAAGGHIVGLEVRDDGLYAIPEYNEAGLMALANGSFRYHSPEIVWEGGSLEDPQTGEMIEGPFIIGDALLHTPHLGEAAALYAVEIAESHSGGSKDMTVENETVTVPVSWLDKFFGRNPEPQEPVVPQVEEPQTDNFEAQFNAEREKAERLEAQIAEMQAERERGERVAHFAAELQTIPAVEQDTELHVLLAGLDEELAGQIIQRFRAVSEQAAAGNITADVGASGGGPNEPHQMLDAAVKELMKAGNVTYNDAISSLAQTRPELFVEVI